MEDYTRVAQVVKPKNLDGQVVCRSADDLPFLLEVGMTVHFVPPSLHGPRTAVVKEVQRQREGAWEVRFSGMETVEDAEAVSGCYCLAATRGVAPMQEEASANQMVGCTLVEATAGPVGQIVEVRPGPAQALLVVRTPQGRDVLVPAVDAFLGPVDRCRRTVHATLPAGLLELE